jgi:hypothetical protein
MRTEGSTSSTSPGTSSSSSSGLNMSTADLQPSPLPHRLLGLLLTDAQVGDEIPVKSWRKLVVTDEVRQCCLLL